MDENAEEASQQDDQTKLLAALSSTVAKIGERVAALSVPQAQESMQQQEKQWSAVELADMVKTGRITEAQAAQVIEDQRNKAIQASIRSTISSEISASTQKAAAEAAIAKYKTALPSLDDKSSPEFQKVKAAFSKLVSRGAPDTLATELTALELAHGPVEGLVKGKKDEGFMRETIGGGRSRQSSTQTEEIKFADDRQRTHYEKLINRGVYRNWDEVKAELNWKRLPPDKRNGKGKRAA